MKGCFITFEGGEGAGKSTQIERIRRRIEAAGRPVLVTREPGGSPKAEQIRDFILSGKAKTLGPFAEAILFSSARMDHLRQTIEPALGRGTHVLCDRFADSTRAYQGALGRLDERLLAALERAAVAGAAPDLTFILDVPAAVGLERARRRRDAKGEATDRFEAEDASFHEALRRAFLEIAKASPERCIVIEANRELDAVEDTVWAALRERLPQVATPARADTDVA